MSMGLIKKAVQKLLWPHTYCGEAYVKYLVSQGVSIGEHTRFISPRQCHIDMGRAEYISIGKNCCFSKITIFAHDYSWYVFAEAFHDIVPDRGGRVTIGNNCFFGYGATILKDTTIGDNVIIGAGAVVKGAIPSNTVWAGVPARQVCTLQELYEKRCKVRDEDAFYRYEMVKRKRAPTVEDMGPFAFLFLQRTQDNYEKYIRRIPFNGEEDSPRLKKIFFQTQPQYNGFEDFVCSEGKLSGN